MLRRGAKPPAHADDADVVVYSREGCHLCEAAETAVRQVCETTGHTWARVDIESDAALVERFSDQVPVTFVRGKQHDFWRVDPRRLQAALGR